MERYVICLDGSRMRLSGVESEGWLAHTPDRARGNGPTPLIAVCALILALHASGKLPAPAPQENEPA